MSKYLKKFETAAQYAAAQSSLILPNVSLITENNKVEYNPLTPTPPTPSHDYVEIGGIKWATMNIGATGITDGGLYFQWGDTQGYTASQIGSGEGQICFNWSNYKYVEGGTIDSDYGTITKYNDGDGLTTLQASDDAVTAAWGGNWRTPTEGDFNALIANTNFTWETDFNGSGVNGGKFTDKNDSTKYVFLPAVGNTDNCDIDGIGEYGIYWCSSIATISQAFGLEFGDNGPNTGWSAYFRRYTVAPVRGVLAN